MAHRHSSTRAHPRLLGSVGSWIRRAALVGSIVVSLAVAGERAVARGGGAGRADAGIESVSNGSYPGLTLAAQFVAAAYRSGARASDAAVEIVSLLVLGLSLIIGGQALARGRRPSDAEAPGPPDRRDQQS